MTREEMDDYKRTIFCGIGRIICGLMCIAFGVFIRIEISKKGIEPPSLIGFVATFGFITEILGVIIVIAAVQELILDINDIKYECSSQIATIEETPERATSRASSTESPICPYCGTLYTRKILLWNNNCPNCGAPITKEAASADIGDPLYTHLAQNCKRGQIIKREGLL